LIADNSIVIAIVGLGLVASVLSVLCPSPPLAFRSLLISACALLGVLIIGLVFAKVVGASRHETLFGLVIWCALLVTVEVAVIAFEYTHKTN